MRHWCSYHSKISEKISFKLDTMRTLKKHVKLHSIQHSELQSIVISWKLLFKVDVQKVHHIIL